MTRSLTDRMKGAAMLDVATYEEVEADESATGQAAVVVALAAVASAIGAIGRGGLTGMIMGLVMAIVGWLAWAGITYFVGTRLFKGTATWGELLRTIGFAQAPGILLVLAIIPVLGMLVRIAVTIWVLVAGIVAIRQALDFDTGKAVMTALVGWLVMVVLTAIVGGSVFRGMM